MEFFIKIVSSKANKKKGSANKELPNRNLKFHHKFIIDISFFLKCDFNKDIPRSLQRHSCEPLMSRTIFYFFFLNN
jgi:hypothetical protein